MSIQSGSLDFRTFLVTTILKISLRLGYALLLREDVDFFYYEGNSRIGDNEFIYQNLLPDSELFVAQNVNIGVAYSCLKYGVFIPARFDA